MARLTFPDEGSRLVYRSAGAALGKASGASVLVYTDSGASVLADLQTVGGTPIAGASMTVDAYSRIPQFLGPDGVDTLYVVVDGGPTTAVYARSDDRIDLAATAAASAQSAADDAQSTADAAQAFAAGGPQKAFQLVDQIRRGKGGKIGTHGKAVISFRYDHKVDPFRTTVWPLHVARGIPGSLGVITRSIGNASAVYEPTTTTWAQVGDMVKQGLELWSHSCTHSDPDDVGTTFSEEITESKSEIEAQGFKVMGWQQPGNPATYGSEFFTPDAMDTTAGLLIRNTYGLYEASLAGTSRRVLPTDGCYGYDHVTIDTLTYSNAKAVVDHAIAFGLGVQFMLHADVVGQPGCISLADLTSLFDYVKQQWDAGTIEILTGTGLAFADPGSSRRLDLVADGDFEGLSTGVFGYNWSQNSGGSWTIGTDGGHSGSNYLRVPNTGTRCIAASQILNLGVDGHAFIVDAWCRATETGGATARVRIRDSGNNVVIRDVFDIVLAQSTEWTHVRVPFVIPVGVSILAVEFGRFTGGSVDWDDCHAYAV